MGHYDNSFCVVWRSFVTLKTILESVYKENNTLCSQK